MKKAVFLHGTNGTNKENWFPWLKKELEKLDFTVWVPNLPQANRPNIQHYNEFLIKNKPWDFDKDTLFIGHSSGAVAILGLLEQLPAKTKVGTCYLVGVFENDLGWDSLQELFIKPLHYNKIKKRAEKFIIIHADNDPYCRLDGAMHIAMKLDGKFIVRSGEKHFSISAGGKQFKEFPFLLEKINNEITDPSVLG